MEGESPLNGHWHPKIDREKILRFAWHVTPLQGDRDQCFAGRMANSSLQEIFIDESRETFRYCTCHKQNEL